MTSDKSQQETTDNKPRLRLSGIYRDFFNGTVVKNLSFEIAPGELVCLLGPSGCGKSTSLRIAAGVEKTHRGEVYIDGKLVAGEGVFLPPEKRAVGLMFQDYALFPHLSVIDNVTFGLKSGTKAEKRDIALGYLERLRLTKYADVFPHTLSGGEQQRVALARAMAPEPKVILLDEPFSGLDRRLRDNIRDQTLALLKDTGAAILMVTHDPEEAMRMADRIAVMRDGELIQIGTPSELYNHPVDAGVAEFFDDANVLRAQVANQVAQTVLGEIPAPGIEDGVLVDIMVRPHALTLAPQGAAATVIQSRLLGVESLIQAKFDAADEPAGETIEIRLANDIPPNIGDKVHLQVDLDKIFVFPHEKQQITANSSIIG